MQRVRGAEGAWPEIFCMGFSTFMVKTSFYLSITLQEGTAPRVPLPTPPCPYLHPGFGQVRAQCQLLPGVDIRVMGLLENLLQLLQLERAEGRPVPPLLALALAQGLRELRDPEAAQGCCQWAPQVLRSFWGDPAGCGNCLEPAFAALLTWWGRGTAPEGVNRAREAQNCHSHGIQSQTQSQTPSRGMLR